jgi:HlyD family secretion protein
MPRRRYTLAILLVAGAAGAAAYVKYDNPEEKAVVQKAPAVSGDVAQTVQAIGALTALRTVRVGSQVSGTVKALYADYNSMVAKDQVIAELDPSLLETQVAVQEANIARQEGDIEQQRVLLAQDRRNLDRMETQFEKGLVSQQQLDTAQLQVKTRTAQLTSLQKQKVLAEAQLNQAKLNVSYCTIRSPIDGVVVSRLVDVGQAVQASVNTPNFFVIATELTTLKIAAGVDEADIGRVRRHMPVTFTVDAYRGQTFAGEVEAVRLNAQIANNVVTYPVWINVPNTDLRLRPSMTAKLQIVVDQVHGATLVPNEALRFRPTSSVYQWLELTPPEAEGRGRRIAPPELVEVAPAERDEPEDRDDKIDELFPPTPGRITPGEVWLYDDRQADPDKRLRRVDVRTGVSDGRFSEVVSGDVQPGAMLVTAVIPPTVVTRPRGSIFQQPGRSFGGMTPSGPAPLPVLRPQGRGGR